MESKILPAILNTARSAGSNCNILKGLSFAHSSKLWSNSIVNGFPDHQLLVEHCKNKNNHHYLTLLSICSKNKAHMQPKVFIFKNKVFFSLCDYELQKKTINFLHQTIIIN